MPSVTQHVPYQHEPQATIGHFDRLYEQNLKCRTDGISALRHADVNPFHVAIQNRTEESPVAVYLLLDQTGESTKSECWFEGDYKAAFEAFRAKATDFNSDHLRLFVSILKPHGSAKATFEHYDPFMDDHRTLMQWSDRYNSWQF